MKRAIWWPLSAANLILEKKITHLSYGKCSKVYLKIFFFRILGRASELHTFPSSWAYSVNNHWKRGNKRKTSWKCSHLPLPSLLHLLQGVFLPLCTVSTTAPLFMPSDTPGELQLHPAQLTGNKKPVYTAPEREHFWTQRHRSHSKLWQP